MVNHHGWAWSYVNIWVWTFILVAVLVAISIGSEDHRSQVPMAIFTAMAIPISCLDESGADVDWWLIWRRKGINDGWGHWISTSLHPQPKWIAPRLEGKQMKDVNSCESGYKQTLLQHRLEGVGLMGYSDHGGSAATGDRVETTSDLSHANGVLMWETTDQTQAVPNYPAPAAGQQPQRYRSMGTSAVWISNSCPTSGWGGDLADYGFTEGEEKKQDCTLQGQHAQCISFNPQTVTLLEPNSDFHWGTDDGLVTPAAIPGGQAGYDWTNGIKRTQMEMVALHLQMRKVRFDTVARKVVHPSGALLYNDARVMTNPPAGAPQPTNTRVSRLAAMIHGEPITHGVRADLNADEEGARQQIRVNLGSVALPRVVDRVAFFVRSQLIPLGQQRVATQWVAAVTAYRATPAYVQWKAADDAWLAIANNQAPRPAGPPGVEPPRPDIYHTVLSRRHGEVASLWNDVVIPFAYHPQPAATPVWSLMVYRTKSSPHKTKKSYQQQPAACWHTDDQPATIVFPGAETGTAGAVIYTDMCRIHCHPRRVKVAMQTIRDQMNNANPRICGGAKADTKKVIYDPKTKTWIQTDPLKDWIGSQMQDGSKEQKVGLGAIPFPYDDVCNLPNGDLAHGNAGRFITHAMNLAASDERTLYNLLHLYTPATPVVPPDPITGLGGAPARPAAFGVLRQPCVGKSVGVKYFALNRGAGGNSILNMPAAANPPDEKGSDKPWPMNANHQKLAWNNDNLVCAGDLNREGGTQSMFDGNFKRGGGAICWKSNGLRVVLDAISVLYGMTFPAAAAGGPPTLNVVDDGYDLMSTSHNTSSELVSTSSSSPHKHALQTAAKEDDARGDEADGRVLKSVTGDDGDVPFIRPSARTSEGATSLACPYACGGSKINHGECQSSDELASVPTSNTIHDLY